MFNPFKKKGYCSKEALKVLNEKEQGLKEELMDIIIKSNAKDREVVRVLAFLINKFKNVR